MATVLITGCSRGLGLEAARQYLAADWKVYATGRNASQCDALLRLAREYPALHVVDLDIADAVSIEALVNYLDGEPLDLLLQNAGVYGPVSSRLQTVTAEAWMETLRVNTVAPLMLVQQLLGNLSAAPQSTIALLSSKMGSIDDNDSGGGYIYRSSKCALNAVGKSLALDLKPEGISVVLLHPGWVKTDMGGPNGLLDVEQSITSLRKVISSVTLDNSGSFLNYDGSAIPW